MPFADASFDVIWSQSAAMNIADRDRLYGEMRRVLKPGGRYAFADLVEGSGEPLHFPVPWAREPSISFLLPAAATRRKLAAAGFEVVIFEDKTAEALAAAETRTQSDRSPTALGLHLILGPDASLMYKNTLRNLQEGRLGLMQGVAARA